MIKPIIKLIYMKIIFSHLLVFCLFFGGEFSFCNATSAPFSFQKKWDWGTVISGKKIQKTYPFQNPTPIPITLGKIYPSCSCCMRLLTPSTIILNPGETRNIVLEMNPTSNPSGRFLKRLYFTIGTQENFIFITGKVVST